MTGIILAAGQSKRMGLAHSKVLLPINNRPILSYIIELAQNAGLTPILVVIAPHHQDIKETFKDYPVKFVIQPQARGTADAVRSCDSLLTPQDDILVLYGDTPLLRLSTVLHLKELYYKKKPDCVILTTFLDNPYGYGRILRNSTGEILAIIEEKDATDEIKRINEINVGVYAFKYGILKPILERITPNTNTGEYYLTNAVNELIKNQYKVLSVSAEDPHECLGINTPADYEFIKKILESQGKSD
ncbi:MAG: NTP transferase domain-containing protein [candidate division WOR-3 bacterium]|nr:NTP transferase domain-containing protein [candidate division WOR-3 bacterium]MCX7757779.1 NTP transferase domain-containing protein [candidate division WOR-3 bacterium]MDW7988067.1 NTP transferase domain-containing protein [candidate division WOR-3 bacterium]